MSTDVARPTTTALVPAKDRSSTVLGEDSILAPKSELTFDLSVDGEDAVTVGTETVDDSESRSRQLTRLLR